MTDAIAALIRGTWKDPDSGEPDRRSDRLDRRSSADLRGREADLVAALELGPRIAVVCDPATHAVLGARVERALGGRAR